MRTKEDAVMAVVTFAIVVLIFFVIAWQSDKCAEDGGTIVRGVFWFTCVDKSNE